MSDCWSIALTIFTAVMAIATVVGVIYAVMTYHKRNADKQKKTFIEPNTRPAEIKEPIIHQEPSPCVDAAKKQEPPQPRRIGEKTVGIEDIRTAISSSAPYRISDIITDFTGVLFSMSGQAVSVKKLAGTLVRVHVFDDGYSVYFEACTGNYPGLKVVKDERLHVEGRITHIDDAGRIIYIDVGFIEFL